MIMEYSVKNSIRESIKDKKARLHIYLNHGRIEEAKRLKRKIEELQKKLG